MSVGSSRTFWRDLALAALLGLGLGLVWTLRDWPNLAQLRLPDTDDAMRLQQIRDWIAGQPFADLAQHRLGSPPGLQMHWSRLPDLVPAALIIALTPPLGGQGAELAAVIAWPLLLFVAVLLLTARIARALEAPAPVAIVVAALAYPASTVFIPGRIDHHGLQLVLILLLVRATLGTGSLRDGAVAGIATALSLAIGLETAPLLVVGAGTIVLPWILDRPGAQARLAGYGVALTLGLVAEAIWLRSSGWFYPACDGFDALLWRAAQIASLAPLALAVIGFATRARRMRIAAALVIGVAASVAALWRAPACLAPYGQVDPLLARLWLRNVAEAQSLFGAPLANAIGYGGLMLAGLLACMMLAVRRGKDWPILLAFQLAAFAIMLVQLRGAYAGALLAAPALAATIMAARASNVLALAIAWIASAGIVYPMIGNALAPAPKAAGSEGASDCTTPRSLARIAALPPGRLLAPVDLGAFALAASRHQVIAAPYHRNNRGNRAMYDFFLADTERSEAIARQWGVDYVALCPGDLADQPEARDPRTLIGALRAGRVPGWLEPVPGSGAAPRIYRLVAAQ